MPFDNRFLAAEVTRNDRLVAGWLFVLCAMILVMVVLGGTTRLTGSGLSIIEWAPLLGTFPPLGEAEWQRLYGLYQQIPQYELVNKGFGLAGFKQIFWLEWTHRLWGRLLGVVFLLPLIALVWRGAIRRRLLPRLLGLFVLGGLQGAVGWFMVASGFFPDSTAVSPYRLVVHLVLALLLYGALFWTALSIIHPTPASASPGLRRLAWACVALVSLTIVAGGFVAGLHAGLTYNTFPLMDGHIIPVGYAQLHPALLNLTENVTAVQFNHRLLATLTALTVLFTVATGLRMNLPRGARLAVLGMAAIVLMQYTLGIATLLSVVAIPLAIAHQGTAVLLLAAALTATHTLRGAK